MFGNVIVYPKNNSNIVTEFQFFIPNSILNYWRKYNLDKIEALNIKQRYFSKIFVFNNGYDSEQPFAVIELNQEWLNNVRNNNF